MDIPETFPLMTESGSNAVATLSFSQYFCFLKYQKYVNSNLVISISANGSTVNVLFSVRDNNINLSFMIHTSITLQ